MFRACKNCEQLRAQLRSAERSQHEAELDSVKWETLAEAFKLEIARLERILDSRQPAAGGGFLPMPLPEKPEPEMAEDAPSFAQRLDEIFGDGLTLEELDRRHGQYRQSQISALELEHKAISEELKRTT